MRKTASLLAAAALAACATAPEPSRSASPLTWAGIGETVYVDGPKIVPMELIEDSRCPSDVLCVWAGTVKIAVEFGGHKQRIELELGKPVHAADGSLELVEVNPPTHSAGAIAREDYRFGLRFMGGL